MTNERVVAGHRVLRLLADGDRSRVWLAAGEVVLKVLTPPVAPATPGREAEALHRARGDHVVELLDASLGDDGAVLVFPRLSHGSLAELLTRRRFLEAGEAVTILAPLATSLSRLHAAGVAHGALSADSVLFRADGAPMLVGFGRAELFEPGIPEVERERIAGVIADRVALLELADAVLARTTGERGKMASRLRVTLRAIPPGELADRMAAELFEVAAARPLRFEVDDDGSIDPAGRVVPVLTEPPLEPSVAVPGVAARLLGSGPVGVVRSEVERRWAVWSVARRRVVLAAGAGGLALVVAFLLVPGPVAPAAPPASADEIVESPVQAVAGGEDVGVEDPLEALRLLADRRIECFRDLSVLCLDGVDESGSSAWDSDRSAIEGILDGGGYPPRLNLEAATLVERLGDSALVDLGPDSDPASVLLLKGEAGWRIRDYVGV